MIQLSIYIIISRWRIKDKNVTHNILQKNRIYLYEAHKARPNISFLKHMANLMSLCGSKRTQNLKRKMGGWGYNYVIECLPNMYEALS
jgi:hypothetical protein